VSAGEHVTKPVAIKRLLALKAVPASDRAFLSAHGREVLAARKQAPSQWETWWWVCVAGEILFLPTIFVLVGRWRPSSARRDREEHERLVEQERIKLLGKAAVQVG